MGLCCSYEKDVNTGCLRLPTPASDHHHHPSAVSPDYGQSRSESNAAAKLQQLQVCAVSGAAVGQKQELLFGMLVHDSRASDVDRGGAAAQQMKALDKIMAAIDACGFKIIAQSCSNCKTGRKAAGAAEAGSGNRKDPCLHVGSRNSSTAHACSKKSRIEMLDHRYRNESFIPSNQTKAVVLPTNVSGIKMGWISVLDSARATKHSAVSPIAQLKNEANKLEAVHWERDETPMSCLSQVGTATTAVRKIQQNFEKKEPTLYTAVRSPYPQNCSFSLERQGEEISIFSADRYFCEEEDDAERNGEIGSLSTEDFTSSGFCFQIESVKSGTRSAAHHANPKISSDLEFSESATSESDLWGSSMKDGESLTRFRIKDLEKAGSTKGTSTTSFSTDGSSVSRWHEDAFMLGCKHRFVEAEGSHRKLEKQQLGRLLQHPCTVQWHLAKVNSHEFVMSPSSLLASAYASPHSMKTSQLHFGDMKQEAARAVDSLKDYCSPALEEAKEGDEFSFDPSSSSCEYLTPQAMRNLYVPAAASATPPAASHGQNEHEAESEYLNFSWEPPSYARTHKNSTASFVDTEDADVSVPDFGAVDPTKECDTPSLVSSYSDPATTKLYHSTDYSPKKHGRNESDDYHSDMSTDLFEIDRLEFPSCVSSPP